MQCDYGSDCVFLFWTGNSYTLIDLFRKLIKKHHKNVHLITPENIQNYIEVDELPDCFDSLVPAHQADVIRVLTLCKHGGIWMDSDTLVLSSLDKLFDCGNGFFIRENNTLLWNGVFGTKKETKLMIEWKRRILNTLKRKKEKIKWTEIGSKVLENMYAYDPTLYEGYTIYNGLDTVYPVNWNNCVKEYLQSDYEHYMTITRNFQPFIVLVNSVYKELKDKNEDEIMKLRCPLVYFLKLSAM